MSTGPDERPVRRNPRPNPRPAPRARKAAAVSRSDQPAPLTADPRSFTVPDPAAARPASLDAPADIDLRSPAQRRVLPPAAPRRSEPLPRPRPDVPVVPDPGLPDQLEAEPPKRSRWRRVRWKRVVAAMALIVVGLTVFSGWYVYRIYQKLERVEVSAVLSPAGGDGTNYLIVGTDTRDGLDAGMENADVVFGEDVAGTRSDTVMVLRMADAGNAMLPIPRDLYVPIAGTDSTNRINTAIQGGPERLIQTVQQSLGVPVHHYVEIDFAGFLELVDAIGGVDIEFDTPAFDTHSGLVVEQAGMQTLNKDQALAFVRSRYYTRIVDGKEVVDGRGDLGRIERQQTFLRAVMRQAGQNRNPFTVARIGNAVASNLRVDDSIGFFDAIGLARKLSGLDPETVELPTDPTRTRGGAAVLVFEQPGAEEALARFR